jgi:hypothetical protein
METMKTIRSSTKLPEPPTDDARYVTMAGDQTKARVLEAIAGSRNYTTQGKAHYRIGGTTVHVRYKSNSSHGAKYPFNINPNTLRADYELWICGDTDGWYLIPIAVIREIYEDPHTYQDRHHPEIRVINVDVETHAVIYGSGGRSVNIAPHRNSRLS